MKKERKSNIELLRIISMILIVAFHCNLNIGFSQSNVYNRILMYVTGIWGILGVDCFFIISFNFLQESKFKTQKLLHLILQILFYAIPLSIVSIIYIKKVTGLDVFTIINRKIITGINGQFWQNVYWFSTIYILMYLTFPILNKILNSLGKKQLKNTIVILTAIIFLYQAEETVIEDYFFAIYMYIFLYYIKKNKENLIKENCKIGVIVTTITIICLKIMLENSGDVNYLNTILKVITGKFNRHSLLFLIDAVFIFYMFKGMNIKQSKIINVISGTTFGIYLFHENQVFSVEHFGHRYLINNILKIENVNSEWYVSLLYIGETLLLFILGMIIDLIRRKVFEENINPKIDKKLEKHYKKIDNWMNCEEKVDKAKEKNIKIATN